MVSCWVVPSVSRSVLEIIVLYSSFRPLEIRPNVAAGSGVKRTQVKSFVHSLSPPTNAWSIWIDAVAAVRLFKVARWRAARMAPRPQRIHKRGAIRAARHRATSKSCSDGGDCLVDVHETWVGLSVPIMARVCQRESDNGETGAMVCRRRVTTASSQQECQSPLKNLRVVGCCCHGAGPFV